jgi:preprotein translocase subunit SecG
MTVTFYLFLFLFVCIAAVVCFVVLIQESKSLGLGASFGGDPGDSVFGTSTAAVLKKITAYLGVVFVILCVILSLWTSTMARNKARLIPPLIENVQE